MRIYIQSFGSVNTNDLICLRQETLDLVGVIDTALAEEERDCESADLAEGGGGGCLSLPPSGTHICTLKSLGQDAYVVALEARDGFFRLGSKETFITLNFEVETRNSKLHKENLEKCYGGHCSYQISKTQEVIRFRMQRSIHIV